MPTQQYQLSEGDRVGGYTLLSLLGRGGMGEVWLAHDRNVERRAALKFIKSVYLDDPGFRGRFLNEAKTFGKLRHERIVTLFHVLDEEPHLALSLEFIEGPDMVDKGVSLADRIDAEGALPLDFVRDSARDVLSALGFAHEQGVIHRDIKPQNVLLDRKNRSFLTDFGIAVDNSAERSTRFGTMVGTTGYMSPEQMIRPWEITMENRGYRTDIYSYGVVLYEMLCGRVPFTGQTDTDVLRAHCEDAPPELRQFNPEVPAALQEVVLQCLSKHPDDRPQSCEDLLRDIEAATSGRKISSTGYKETEIERPAVTTAAKAAAAPPAPAATPAVRKSGLPKFVWPAAGVLVVAAGIGYVATRPSTPVANPHPGQEYFQQARGFADKKDFCGGRDAIATAVNLEKTNTEYTDLQKRIKDGCEQQNRGPRGGTGPSAPTGTAGTTGTTGTTPPSKAAAVARAAEAAKLAVALLADHNPDAKEPGDQALALDPDNPYYRDLKKKVDQLIAAIGRSSDLVSQANELYRNGEYCKALDLYNQAAEITPWIQTFKKEQASAKNGCNLR